MTEPAFRTELLESGNLLVGPWRSPKQMLHAQVYDSHASILGARAHCLPIVSSNMG